MHLLPNRRHKESNHTVKDGTTLFDLTETLSSRTEVRELKDVISKAMSRLTLIAHCRKVNVNSDFGRRTGKAGSQKSDCSDMFATGNS